ncbi:MAG: hypothetical protein L0L92_01345, partial [Corynebacterium variabile]|nr:hypothetical protein [Corynebacterium variabile]
MNDLTPQPASSVPSVTPQTVRLGYWDGEGIGPEITPPTRRAVELALMPDAVTVDWVPLLL